MNSKDDKSADGQGSTHLNRVANSQLVNVRQTYLYVFDSDAPNIRRKWADLRTTGLVHDPLIYKSLHPINIPSGALILAHGHTLDGTFSMPEWRECLPPDQTLVVVSLSGSTRKSSTHMSMPYGWYYRRSANVATGVGNLDPGFVRCVGRFLAVREQWASSKPMCEPPFLLLEPPGLGKIQEQLSKDELSIQDALKECRSRLDVYCDAGLDARWRTAFDSCQGMDLPTITTKLAEASKAITDWDGGVESPVQQFCNSQLSFFWHDMKHVLAARDPNALTKVLGEIKISRPESIQQRLVAIKNTLDGLLTDSALPVSIGPFDFAAQLINAKKFDNAVKDIHKQAACRVAIAKAHKLHDFATRIRQAIDDLTQTQPSDCSPEFRLYICDSDTDRKWACLFPNHEIIDLTRFVKRRLTPVSPKPAPCDVIVIHATPASGIGGDLIAERFLDMLRISGIADGDMPGLVVFTGGGKSLSSDLEWGDVVDRFKAQELRYVMHFEKPMPKYIDAIQKARVPMSRGKSSTTLSPPTWLESLWAGIHDAEKAMAQLSTSRDLLVWLDARSRLNANKSNRQYLLDLLDGFGAKWKKAVPAPPQTLQTDEGQTPGKLARTFSKLVQRFQDGEDRDLVYTTCRRLKSIIPRAKTKDTGAAADAG